MDKRVGNAQLRNELIVLISVLGLRSSEVRALRWMDMDLNDGKIIVRNFINADGDLVPIKGRSRTFSIPPVVKEKLLEYKYAVVDEEAFVFHRSGDFWAPLSKDTINRIIKAYRPPTEDPPVSLSSLNRYRSIVFRLKQKGFSEDFLAELKWKDLTLLEDRIRINEFEVELKEWDIALFRTVKKNLSASDDDFIFDCLPTQIPSRWAPISRYNCENTKSFKHEKIS